MGLWAKNQKIDSTTTFDTRWPKSCKAVKCEAMAACGDMVVVKFKDGRWWTNWRGLKKFSYPPSMWGGKSDKLLQCLVSLDIIAKSDYDEYIAVAERKDAERDRQFEMSQLGKSLKKAGLPYPPELADEIETALKNKRII